MHWNLASYTQHNSTAACAKVRSSAAATSYQSICIPFQFRFRRCCNLQDDSPQASDALHAGGIDRRRPHNVLPLRPVPTQHAQRPEERGGGRSEGPEGRPHCLLYLRCSSTPSGLPPPSAGPPFCWTTVLLDHCPASPPSNRSDRPRWPPPRPAPPPPPPALHQLPSPLSCLPLARTLARAPPQPEAGVASVAPSAAG